MRDTIGVLLINLGTPTHPSPKSVKRYLAEFLMDPEVIDLPWPMRALLVHGIILNTRPKKSAEAYQKIWHPQKGSPLLSYSREWLNRVRQAVQSKNLPWRVELGMRYGEPSISNALNPLSSQREGLKKLVVLPLYPQYSLAATESAFQKTRAELKRQGWTPQDLQKIIWIRSFYEHPPTMQSYARRIVETARDFSPDFLLFSYHGLPERHISKLSGAKAHGCLQNCQTPASEKSQNGIEGEGPVSFGCCEREFQKRVPDCYRAQCMKTSKAIGRELLQMGFSLRPDQMATSFQSRLNSRWVRPFSDDYYKVLPKRGYKRLMVVSPSFVADCLETLEEIQIRGKEDFILHGGQDLKLVPSLNSEEDWAENAIDLIRSHLN